ncbi:MAG: hypothetical protein SFZ24_04400 [Planctomycetota bacterium]|nr:hypothetical protein [Planctomycetota bacterium]
MKCEQCGNTYDRMMEVTYMGATHHYDCFECAIHALAPWCAHCGCRVIGHGLDQEGSVYCCTHCQRHGPRSVGG